MKGSCIAPLKALEGRIVPEGSFLVLIEPGRIPPHLASIHDGLYYSLSVKGVEREKDANKVLRTLERKGKPLLLIPFRTSTEAKGASSVFASYEGSEPPISSCLAPLRELCGFSREKVPGTVHDLIRELDKEGRLLPPFFYRNMESPANNEFWIPDYDEEEVREHLRRYEQGKAGQ